MTARVVIGGGQALFRAAIRALLDGDERVCVVGDGRRGEELVGVVDESAADLVVVDAGPESVRVVERCSALKAKLPEVRVIVIDDEADELRLMDLVEVGVDGYLTRLDAPDVLFDAIEQVLGGHAFIPTEMLGGLLRSLIERRRERDSIADRFGSLTSRELEVLELMKDGSSNDEMAEVLFISPATVRTHVQNVLRKLEVHSQIEAAALVRRHGLFDDDVAW